MEYLQDVVRTLIFALFNTGYMLLFYYAAQRKKGFLVRLLLCLGAQVAWSFIAPLLNNIGAGSFITSTLKFGVCYIILFVNAFFCYNLKIYNHLVLLMMIEIAGQVARSLHTLTTDISLLGNYDLHFAIDILISAACYALFAGIAWLLVRKQIKVLYDIRFSAITIVMVAFIMIIFGLMHLFTETIKNASLSMYLAFISWHIALCAGLFFFVLAFVSKFKSDSDKEVANYLFEESRKQFQQQQENIEIINIKCHDLRYKLADVEGANKAIDEYDSNYNTGNRTLDVVLTEKSGRCLVKNIEFTAMANGELLSFMDEADIFFLFNNAIDNAIEAEEAYDEGKRFISVVVKKNLDMVIIRIENYFEGKISLVNGFPKTTKKDKAFHGFGTKSIARIVERYGGTTSFDSQENTFTLLAVFFENK